MMFFRLASERQVTNMYQFIRQIFVLLVVLVMLGTGCATTEKPENLSLKSVKGPEMSEKDTRPFEQKKIVQIGLVVRDVEKTARAWAQLLGREVPEVIITEPQEKALTQYHGKPTKAQAKLAFLKFDNIVIEIIEPIGGPSTWQEFLDTEGEGVHHIAFEVKGMDEQIALLESKGQPLVHRGRWTGGSGGAYAYIDSAPQLAVMLELLENY
jgi:methylmalonyl-CoA/ethylmalonyl-CoA epimerase